MIMVTGANGQFGALTVQALADLGVSAVGGSRTPTADQRKLDFDDRSTLDFSGILTLILVSAGYAEDDRVVSRHRAALEAAARDGVKHVVYTSLTTEGDHLAFALAHRATEELVKQHSPSWTILRNGLYAELFGGLLTWTNVGLQSAFADGALAAVARQDLAAVAANVAANSRAHAGRTYDLVGTPITASEVAGHLGVSHKAIGLGEYRKSLLTNPDLLPFQPPMLSSIATNVRHGRLSGTGTDLARLLGKTPTDPRTVAAMVAASTRPPYWGIAHAE